MFEAYRPITGQFDPIENQPLQYQQLRWAIVCLLMLYGAIILICTRRKFWFM
jgi:hypothetical protein